VFGHDDPRIDTGDHQRGEPLLGFEIMANKGHQAKPYLHITNKHSP
jgi:hypothetical protein